MNKIFVSSAAVMIVASGAWAQEDPCGGNGGATTEWGEPRCGIISVQAKRLDPVIVEGLRPADVSTGSYSHLEAGDLLIRNAPNIASDLRAVPGIGVSQSGGAGALTQVRMRGAEANHTLVFLDGVEISDPTTGETDFGLLTGIPISNARIISGEQSAAHGSDAIGGVISLSTDASSKTTGFVEIGSRDTARGALSKGISPAGLPLIAGISGFTHRGVDTSGLGGERDGSDALGVFASSEKKLSRNWDLSTLAMYRQSTVETDPDSDFDGRLDDEDRTTESEQFLIGATIESRAGLVGSGYTDHIIRASYNTVSRENSANGQSVDETTGRRFNLSWSPSKKTVDQNLQQWFSGLFDYEKEDYERESTDTFFGDPNQSASFETFGIGGEYRAKFRNGLNLHAIGRRDLNDGRFEDATTWRVGAAYEFDFDGRVRASVGTGVKNPTFTELFGFFPGSFIGNPGLKPEQSLGWEIGWDQQIKDVTFSATYFQAELEDEIVTRFTPSFESTPANLEGNSERSGIEFAASWQATDNLSIAGSAAFIDSQNDKGVDEIRVPQETASLSIDWRSEAYEGLRAGLAFDYVGQQLDTDFSIFQTARLDPYTLVSATAEIPFSPRVSFTLRGDNLLDEDAVDVIGFNKPGRGLYVGFKLR